MTNTAGPMVSSSIAASRPPWIKPAGLQNSALPTKPIRIHPCFGRASSKCQPSNLEDGGASKPSSAVLTMTVPSVAPWSIAVLLTAWCQQRATRLAASKVLEAEPVRDHLAHEVWQRFIPERGDRHPAHALR